MQRTQAIAGLTLLQLARQLNEPVPEKLNHAKGWIGQLLEKALGATAGSLPEPDFQQLGIELKTLPVNRNGQPRESTYVCTVPLQNNHDLVWHQSWVRNKLKRVLWVPIESDKQIPVTERHIGQAILWSPSPQQEKILQQDWEELMDMVCTGQLAQISARHGTYLQIRPKAANASSLVNTEDEHGQAALTLPRGFYLRTIFTEQILKQGFHSAVI
jgi:DNA mismatch repair protein MutH